LFELDGDNVTVQYFGKKASILKILEKSLAKHRIGEAKREDLVKTG
jgi:hypothetical protein